MITPIRCGIDTLEATFTGEIDVWVTKELFNRKTKAQVANSPEAILLGGETFYVQDKGAGLYSYVVKNRDITLKIALSKNVPPMAVRLSSQGLASRGVDNLLSTVNSIAEEMGLTIWNLTRIDVAVDFQGWEPTYAEMLNVVCKTNFRPVYPNTEHPETFQFGKGQVVVRLYNKTKEIEVSKKQWWHNVWRLHRYDAGLPVWRLEVQLRSTALKELDRREVKTAVADAYGLFCYGLDWCSLRVSQGDSNLRRAPEHSVWVELREKYAPAKALGRIRPVVRQMTYDAAIARIAGLLASAGAAIDLDDYDAVCDAVKADAIRHIHQRKEIDFPDLVEQKRHRQESGE